MVGNRLNLEIKENLSVPSENEIEPHVSGTVLNFEEITATLRDSGLSGQKYKLLINKKCYNASTVNQSKDV